MSKLGIWRLNLGVGMRVVLDLDELVSQKEEPSLVFKYDCKKMKCSNSLTASDSLLLKQYMATLFLS